MRFSTVAAALTAPLLVSAVPMKYKRASDNDILVMQFAEVLERLEAQFYQEALDKFVEQDFIDAGIQVPDVAIQNFQDILQHEMAHTDFLNNGIESVGAQPIQNCVFNFDAVLTDVATMAAVARVVEAVGVGAYLGAAGLVDDKNTLAAAASILTIEARHQSFLNTINGATSVPQAFDIALAPEQVLSIAQGFITGCDDLVNAVTPNPPLTITNQGAIGVGTLLTFDSPALAGVADQELSCQMLVGGQETSLSLPLAECVVPAGINGPVALFLTTGTDPLSSNVLQQDKTIIVAGPTIAFLDTVPDALGALVRASGPVDSSEDLTPDEAQQLLDGAQGNITDPALGQITDPNLAPLDPNATQTDSAAIPSLTAVPDPTASQPPAAVSDPNAPPQNAILDPNAPPAPPTPTGTGDVGTGVKVIGHSEVPI